MAAPQTIPAQQQKPVETTPDREPLVARVRAHNKYADTPAGGTVTFTVRRDEANGVWVAFANKSALGSAPHKTAAWRIVDAEMRRCKHALTTDEADTAEAATASAAAAALNPHTSMFRAYKAQAQAAKAAAAAARVRTESAKLESLGIPVEQLRALASIPADVLAEARRIVADRAAKK